MPRRRRKNKRRRRRKRQRNNQLIVRGPQITPDSLMVRMNYSANFALTSASGAFAQHVFRGNSIFDPDLTGAGGQPLGHDQWQGLYKKYQVMASKIRVQMVTAPTPTAGAVMYIAPLDQSTSLVGVLQGVEQPYAVSTVLSPFTSKTVQLDNYLSTKSKFGYKKVSELNILAANFNTSPAEEFFWSVGMSAVDGAGDVTLHGLVQITYFVKLFDRLDLGRS